MTASKILTPAKLVAMLKKVPEKKLRIFTLAPQLLTSEGKVDIEKCMDRHGELLPAIEEVKHYSSDCSGARYRLEGIRDIRRAEEFDIDLEDEVGDEE